MKDILLCSSNQLLIKNLYGVLRDAGYGLCTVEHPAFAVQKVMTGTFALVIIDAEPFGLSADEAVAIMKACSPGLAVLSLGGNAGDVHSIPAPFDLEELRRTIHAVAAA